MDILSIKTRTIITKKSVNQHVKIKHTYFLLRIIRFVEFEINNTILTCQILQLMNMIARLKRSKYFDHKNFSGQGKNPKLPVSSYFHIYG